MKAHSFFKAFCLSALLIAPPCFASVVGSSEDINFDNTFTTFNFGGSSFTLTDNNDFFSPVSISTQGSASITSLSIFGPTEPSSFFDPVRSGSLIFNGDFYQYSAFTEPTVIKFSSGPTFIGLRVEIDEEFYYGYAQFAGTLLNSYGFETTPNLGIEAGAAITEVSAVPLPAAWALMLPIFAMFGFGVRNRQPDVHIK